MTRKDKNNDIDFNSKFIDLNKSIRNVNKSFKNLQDILLDVLNNPKVHMSNYKCPKCKTNLLYDYAGDERIQLYCPNCDKYVRVKIENLEEDS